MAADPPPVYLVHAGADPVVLVVQGRASYLNCAPVEQFFKQMLAQGRRQVVIDCARCTGMDSTFLGLLMGLAFGLQDQEPPGALTLVSLNARNLELVRNLGLHKFATVESGDFPMDFVDGQARALPAAGARDAAGAKLILQAHQNLIAADESNRAKFQDVLTFLKAQAGREGAQK